MSDAKVNWENLKCLYAEDLKNKRFTLTVGDVRETPKGARLFCPKVAVKGVENSGYSEAWDVAFAEKAADGRTPYIQIPKLNQFGKATGLLRTYKVAMGGEPCADHVGHKLVLHPVQSAKSQTGQAIRIAVQEGQA
jgi:hypothetical protein